MRKKYSIIIILLITIFGSLSGQTNIENSCDVINRDTLHSDGNYECISKKSIKLTRGFKYKSSEGNGFKAKTDIYKICELDANSMVDPYSSENPYQHDTSLTVGSIPGAAGVSPTGAATYEIPIFTSPGTAGMEPSVSVVYNSQSGNSILGMGWHLSGLSSISLSPNIYYNDGYFEAVKFNNDGNPKDRYQIRYALDGNRLVCVNGNYADNNSEYRTEMESFCKIDYKNDAFIVQDKNGFTSYYGSNNNSKLKLGTGSGNRTLNWNINKVVDNNGNYINYEYYTDREGELLIKRISYTGNESAGLSPYCSVEFLYAERSDKSSSFISGTKFNQTVVLEKILVKYKDAIIKQYIFKYSVDQHTKLSEIVEQDQDGNRLNSTVIEWGEKNAVLNLTENPFGVAPNPCSGESNCSVEEKNYNFLVGDFNRDGIEDVAVVYNALTKMNNEYYPFFSLQVYLGTIEDDIVRIFSLSKTDGYYKAFVLDYDYNGSDEIFIVNTENNKTYKCNLESTTGFITTTQIQSLEGYGLSGNIYGNGKPSFYKYGNNYIELNYFENNNSERPDRNELNSLSISNPFIQIYDSYYNEWLWEYLISNRFDHLIDFDGDGVSDILGMHHNVDVYLKIFEFNQSEGEFKSLFTIPHGIIHPDDFANSPKLFRFGDFNGDGKTDLMVRERDRGIWKIYHSNGKEFVRAGEFAGNAVYEFDVDNFYKLFTIDLDGDGKDEIVEYKDTLNSNMEIVTYLYISKYVDGEGFKTEYVNRSLNFCLNKNIAFVDFNGDGKKDIFFRSGGKYKVLYLEKNAKNNLVMQITDGLKLKNKFIYRNFTHHSWLGRENIEVNEDIRHFIGALPVVHCWQKSNAVESQYNATYFKFNTGIFHVKGKSFLGFRQIEITDETSNIITRTENIMNKNNYIVDSTYIITWNLNREMLSTQSSKMYIKTMSESNKNWISAGPLRQITNDYTLGHVRSTSMVHEYYNMNSPSQSFYGNVYKTIAVDPEGLKKTTTYSSYINAGSWCSSIPTLITETISKNYVSETMSFRKNYTFNNKRQLLNLHTDSYPSGGKHLAETYTYDVFGNILTKKVTGDTGNANGLQDIMSEYEYDNRGRFLVKTKNASSNTEEFVYDPYLGNIIESQNYLGNITKFEYDKFGNLLKTISPLGRTTNIERNWSDNTNNNSLYYVRTYGDGIPESMTRYDLLGREILGQTEYYGNILIKEKQYQPDGLLKKERLPYFSTSSNENWKKYSYDELKRITTHNVLNMETEYEYSGRDITITTPDNVSRTKKMNRSGWIMNVQSDKDTVLYTYNINGNPKTIFANSSTTLFNYDSYGRQTELIDVNTGLTKYEYNAFGQLIKQEDNEGNIFKITYNPAGQIIAKDCEGCTEHSVSYSYNNYGQISQEAGNNETIKRYEYDNYGRLKTVRERVLSYYIYEYEYDEYSNLSTIKYPSGYTVSNEYNENGELIGVYEGNNATVWKISGSNSINEMGQFTNYKLGPNEINCIFTYNNYYELENMQTGNVFAYQYNWDHSSGNLLSRKDLKKSLREEFSYDNQHRLTNWEIYYNNILKSLDTVDYKSNGNISYKSDVGDYEYNSDKVHALEKLTNTKDNPFLIFRNQEIEYTSFGKVSSITERDDETDEVIYKYEIKYGPDQERKMTKLYNGETLVKTKYYLGLYEKEVTASGDTKEFHYIPGGDGIAAVHIITNGNADLGKTYYFVTDYLGSVMSLIDENQNIIEEHSYDPWGNLRNPNNWSFENVNTSFLVNMGYTGHEMLPEFGLINMNGRMYDPVIARILSPDNYVQSPLNAQNYNRYSYCLNNPLKYSDPSGNSAILTAAIVGAYLYTTINGMTGKINSHKDFYSSIVIGAASGAVGGAITGASIPMASTLSIMGASLTNSIGNWAFTGGQAPISISFGAASYNFTSGEFGYLGKKGNKWYENVVYGLGALANLSDILMGFNSDNYGKVDLITEHSDGLGHCALVNEGSETGGVKIDPNGIISVGPDWMNSVNKARAYWMKGTNDWKTYSNNSIDHPILRQTLAVNKNTIEKYANWLYSREAAGKLVYSVVFSSCVTHTSRALNLSGVFNIGIHPYLLHAQMHLWGNGIRPWTFNYFFNNY